MICEDFITITDSNSIPTKALAAVAETRFDFTEPRMIGEPIDPLKNGYDNNFVLRNQNGGITLAAWVLDPKSGRILKLHTTDPGVQI